MLRRAATGVRKKEVDLLLPDGDEDPISGYINRSSLAARLAPILEQAGVSWTPAKLVLFSCCFALAGVVACVMFLPSSLPKSLAFAPTVFLGSLPLLSVLRKRRKKFSAFEEQFPDALDFLARSMRAGHAFSISMEMMVADSPDPIQSEFRQVVQDVQFGSSLEAALSKLTSTVPLIDVRFFVSSVILQQGTGGNLSEILTSMSVIIRDRFRLKGQVKAAAAHGKVTGLVLALMPIVVGLMMAVISPQYLAILFRDSDGKLMFYGSIAAQIVGYLCIRKIVEIKV